MYCLRNLKNIVAYKVIQRYNCEITSIKKRCEVLHKDMLRTLSVTACIHKEAPIALRRAKPKSKHKFTMKNFVDIKRVSKYMVLMTCQFMSMNYFSLDKSNWRKWWRWTNIFLTFMGQ